MSSFCQRKSVLKGLYTFIRNNTGIQICAESKVSCSQNTTDFTGFVLQRCCIYKSYYDVVLRGKKFMDIPSVIHDICGENIMSQFISE